jgi:hypothetical protein
VIDIDSDLLVAAQSAQLCPDASSGTLINIRLDLDLGVAHPGEPLTDLPLSPGEVGNNVDAALPAEKVGGTTVLLLLASDVQDDSLAELSIQLLQLVPHPILTSPLDRCLGTRQRLEVGLLMILRVTSLNRCPDREHPVSDQVQPSDYIRVAVWSDPILGTRQGFALFLHYVKYVSSPVLIHRQVGFVLPPRGEAFDQPVELSPRTLVPEEVEQIDPQLFLEVILDGLAKMLDQLDESPEPPGNSSFASCASRRTSSKCLKMAWTMATISAGSLSFFTSDQTRGEGVTAQRAQDGQGTLQREGPIRSDRVGDHEDALQSVRRGDHHIVLVARHLHDERRRFDPLVLIGPLALGLVLEVAELEGLRLRLLGVAHLDLAPRSVGTQEDS